MCQLGFWILLFVRAYDGSPGRNAKEKELETGEVKISTDPAGVRERALINSDLPPTLPRGSRALLS